MAGFQAMFEGRHPTTGELLGRPHGRNAVPAFDVVFRPAKSISLVYGLGDPAIGRAVLEAAGEILAAHPTAWPGEAGTPGSAGRYQIPAGQVLTETPVAADRAAMVVGGEAAGLSGQDRQSLSKLNKPR